MLFRLLAWQGSTVEIVAGLVLGAGVQLWAFVAGRGSGQPVATSVFRRTALLMAIGGIVLLTPVSSIIRWFHRDDTALAEKMVYQHEHPDDPAAAQAVRQHLQAKPEQL
ncbi:hypothetical protein [Hymenobacter actinosclerus]|uniref:hypothetical protein n=1 Tax=Hymenobacter actinosclerus TaxID=82805 RepID=UPI001160430F|nr:hypothetical protein [Hymenobacter actinosclerus]